MFLSSELLLTSSLLGHSLLNFIPSRSSSDDEDEDESEFLSTFRFISLRSFRLKGGLIFGVGCSSSPEFIS